ncbi:hypothetical protein JL720_3053 [Aureococcus anophagefferens]|nr:hypothetical protein JL720_3053 [Aureococcus anophagefferens]
MGASWLPLWLAVVVAREARWAPQRELERRHPDDALNASARVRRELERTVDAYPKARSDEDALRLARQALAATQHFVLLWQNRIFCAADHLHADKHKIHYMFSLIASMAERAPLPNALFVWDQGARGTGCPPGAPETPCFVIAKVSGYGARGILVPNPYFCHLRFWDDRAGRIRGAAALRPFAGRDPRLFWRGGVTRSCNPGNVARVAAISLTSDDATAFDVRCTSCQPPNSDACGGAFNYTASMRHLADGRNRSLFVEPHDFSRWRHVLNMPGTMGGSYSRHLNHLWNLGSTAYWRAALDAVRTRQRQARVLDDGAGSLLHDALHDVDCEALREFVLADDAGAPMDAEHDFFGGHPGTFRALGDWDDLKFACLAS